MLKDMTKHNKKVCVGRKSGENSDKDLNIHSSRDYWEEIEPKMNEAAKNLDFSVVKQYDYPTSPGINIVSEDSEMDKTYTSMTPINTMNQ